MSASLSLILTLSILLIPVRSHYKANTRMTKVWAPIITLIPPQPDKQTVTRHPVLLLGLTCHTTTVFAQLKLDCYSMRKFKVQFLLFNNFALWIGELNSINSTPNPIHLQKSFVSIKLSNPNKNTFTKLECPVALSLSLSCDGWWLWEWRGPGGDRQAPGELVTPGPA